MNKTRKNYKTPTAFEVDVLTKIAKESKMDCWFSVKSATDKNGEHIYIAYDIEENHPISWNKAIETIYEGMTRICDYNLKDIEVISFVKLLEKDFVV